MDPLPDEVLASAGSWLRDGMGVALATVIETWGSAPCPAGSRLAVSDAGHVAGSVSAGCVEAAVIEAALEAIADRATRRLSFGVSDDDAWSVGLACGGTISVFVQAVTPALLEALAAARAGRRSAVLVTRLQDGLPLLLVEDAGCLVSSGKQAFAVDAATLAAITALAVRALAGEGSRIVRCGEEEWFLHVHAPPPRLLLVGAVHIAQQLAPLAQAVGFAVSVIDPRESFATAARFPGSTLLTEWPDEGLRALSVDRHSAIVVLTHDRKLDDPALEVALRSPAFYVGALGSDRTQASRRTRLGQAGLGDGELDRLRGPVGLPIGAVGAAEIAVSILAEIVAVRRGGRLGDRGAWPARA